MNRRDFLRLNTDRGTHTVELSCQRLYMSYIERRATSGRPDEDFDPTEGGEPPTAFEERTTEQLFASLEHDLDGADVLRVRGHRWLSEGEDELLREFDKLVSSFKARGGRVEFG